jgi:hypothetical protein
MNGAKASAWSIRNMVRYFAAHDISLDDLDAVKRFLGKEPTVAQQIALKGLKKALNGDMRAIEYATDQIDGKLPQTIAGDPDNPLVTNDSDTIVRTILGLAAKAKSGGLSGESEVDSSSSLNADNSTR